MDLSNRKTVKRPTSPAHLENTATSVKSRATLKNIIPMTALMLSQVKFYDNGYHYKGKQFVECYMIGKLVEAIARDFKYEIIFTDGTSLVSIYVSKFHKHLQQQINSALNQKTYWRVFLTPKTHQPEETIEFYCFKLEEVRDHNQISDHIANVMAHSIKVI